MRDGGKGDTPRPLGVPKEQFDSNWDAIFKKRLADKIVKQIQESIEEQKSESTSSSSAP